MTQELAKRNPYELTTDPRSQVIPSSIADQGEEASWKFLDFFAAGIGNDNTRLAYYRATLRFFSWTENWGLALKEIKPSHVGVYMKQLGENHATPTVKLHLAAVRMLLDWLVMEQVITTNPAKSAKGPNYSTTTGKTPVLSDDEIRQLLSSIKVTYKIKDREVPHVVGLRDRALIGVLFFGLARIGAVVSMNVEDYFPQGKRWWFQFREKRGKFHRMPAHHTAEDFVDAYLDAAEIRDDKKTPLFRTANRKTKTLTQNRMNRRDAFRMVRRRARDAGINTRIGCHSFRASGITNYLEHDGTLEKAQQMAAHSSARTTKLYDRRDDKLTLDEIEKIQI